jgi:hypothetical protein
MPDMAPLERRPTTSDWNAAIDERLAAANLEPERRMEIVHELSQHLDDRYGELRSAGASEDAARSEALSEVDEGDLVRELTGIAPLAIEPLALGGGPKATAFGGLGQDLRFGARLLVKDAAASIGLVVAVTGVYGVTAFSVGQRRHEIGVRLALGATAGDVLRLIAGRSFCLIGCGAVLGIAGGWAIGLTMRSLLFGVGASDPVTYAAVLSLVALCGFVATYLPAHHAMSIDPMTILKRD